MSQEETASESKHAFHSSSMFQKEHKLDLKKIQYIYIHMCVASHVNLNNLDKNFFFQYI